MSQCENIYYYQIPLAQLSLVCLNISVTLNNYLHALRVPRVLRSFLVVRQKIFLVFIDSSTTLTLTLPFFLGKSSRRPDVLPPNPNPTPNLTLFQCERVGCYKIIDLMVLRQEIFNFPFDSNFQRVFFWETPR